MFTAKVPLGAGYQVPFAERIKRAAPCGPARSASYDPSQADEIVQEERADLVLLAREMLRQPYWPLQAARELGHAVRWPAQYLRAAPAGSEARS